MRKGLRLIHVADCALFFSVMSAVACNDMLSPGQRAMPNATTNASQNAHTIVTADSMQGWTFVDDQASSACTDAALCGLAAGPGTPTLGRGSAELATPFATSGIALAMQGYGGTRIDNITELSYATYRQTSDPGDNLAIALQLTVDFDLNDASNAWQGRLVFEPYQGASGQVLQSTWQRWDAMAGKWWGTRANVIRGGVATANPCVQSSPCSWTQLLSSFPNAGVHRIYGSIFLKAGSNWAGFRGNVDGLTIGVGGMRTTYDFELTRNAPVPEIAPDFVPPNFFSDSNLTTDATR